MKRYNNLFSKICDIENIRLAHHNARKGKTSYGEVKYVDRHEEECLLAIKKMLESGEYKTSEYIVFVRKFYDKERTIYKLPYYPDRIVHHCIVQVLSPIWEKTFIRNTFSSIKNRGIHDAVKRIKKDIKNESNVYCLKLDIKKFYPSVDHDILKTILRKKIKDTKVLQLLDSIIDSAEGVPIGNYLSQFFGNLYLTYFDHYVKEQLQCKFYYRYCDDIVILHSDKDFLHRVFAKIKLRLNRNLNLIIKKNYQIFPLAKRGIDFLGYVFYKHCTYIRKEMKQRYKKKIALVLHRHKFMKDVDVVSGVMSYFGWFKYANAYHLWRSYTDSYLQNILFDHGCTKLVV